MKIGNAILISVVLICLTVLTIFTINILRVDADKKEQLEIEQKRIEVENAMKIDIMEAESKRRIDLKNFINERIDYDGDFDSDRYSVIMIDKNDRPAYFTLEIESVKELITEREELGYKLSKFGPIVEYK